MTACGRWGGVLAKTMGQVCCKAIPGAEKSVELYRGEGSEGGEGGVPLWEFPCEGVGSSHAQP